MTFTARAIPQNVVQSLRDYVKTNITSVPVQFGDGGQREEAAPRWLEFTLQEAALSYQRHTASSSTKGGVRVGLLAVALREKWPLQDGDNIFSLDALLRTVLQLFHPGQTISVKDFAGGSEAVFGLVEVRSTSGKTEVSDGRDDPQVRQWSVVITLEWIEEWT